MYFAADINCGKLYNSLSEIDTSMTVQFIGKSAVKQRQLRRNQRNPKQGRGSGDARRLAQEVRSLRRLIHVPEEKNLDVDASTTPSTTGVLTLLSGLAQGTDIGNRVGDVIKVTRVSWNGRVAISSASSTFSTVRLIMFRDSENAGSVPVLADILEATGGTTAARSPINFINRKRFNVLWDQMIVLDSTSQYSEVVRGDMIVNKTVRYRGTGNTVAAAAEGTIYWLFVSDEATNVPSVVIYTQLQFVDS